MEARNARTKAEKKDKKSQKKAKFAAAAATSTVTSESLKADALSISTNTAPKVGAIKTELLLTPSGVLAASSSKLPSKSGTTSKNPVKPFLKREATSEVLTDPALKKLKGDNFSVAADPKASNVYKSLFTSHKSEQEQTRAHWVTYNPFYN